MNRSQNEHPGSGISTGNVQGMGIVIGHGSSSSIQAETAEQREAIAKLEEFLRLLTSYESSVPDASDIRETVQAAKAEAGMPSPRWQVVRGLLRGIAAGVTGVSALSDAINNVLASVAHFSH